MASPIQLALLNWNRQNKLLKRTLSELSEAQMLKEIAPGKNTGRYILGHLAAVHDFFFPLFGLGEKMHPEIEKIYIRTPDNPTTPQASIAELNEMYNAILEKLNAHFEAYSEEDWLGRHMNISEEDFAKEPHRNKLNVLMGRTNHLAYHVGQLVLLKK